MRELGRNMVACIGIWMKPRRRWASFVAVLDSEIAGDLKRIRERQDVIQVFMDHFFEQGDLTDSLRGL